MYIFGVFGLIIFTFIHGNGGPTAKNGSCQLGN